MNFLKNPPPPSLWISCGFVVSPKCQQATWHLPMKIHIQACVPPALEPHLPACRGTDINRGGKMQLSPWREGSRPQGRAPRCQHGTGTSRRAPFPAALLALLPRSRFLEFLTPHPAQALPRREGGRGTPRPGGDWPGTSEEDARALPPGPSSPQRALCCRSRARKEPLSGRRPLAPLP